MLFRQADFYIEGCAEEIYGRNQIYSYTYTIIHTKTNTYNYD